MNAKPIVRATSSSALQSLQQINTFDAAAFGMGKYQELITLSSL